MKTHIIIELQPEEKLLIKESAKKLSLPHSTFCRMTMLREAQKIKEAQA